MSKARELANLGNAYSDGALSNRNLIINGGMQVAQRGTSFTSPESNTFTLDRWKYEESTANVVDVEQSSDAPAGFERSIKVTTTTAAGSVGASDFAQLLYKIEGHDLSRLAYGTSDAKTSTLSFWVKSSVTGSFPFGLQNHDGSRVFPVTYTVNAANTWEYKTITIAGDTGGTWTTSNNTTGMRFTFFWISGSNFTGGVDGGGWAATTGFADLTSTYTANLDVVNATLQITGVQLEVGDTATPFEHRSYGDELARCKRYFERIGIPAGSSYQSFGVGHVHTSVTAVSVIPYEVEKRVNPTASYDTGSNFALLNAVGSAVACTAASTSRISTHAVSVTANASGLVAGNATFLLANNTAKPFIDIDAEL